MFHRCIYAIFASIFALLLSCNTDNFNAIEDALKLNLGADELKMLTVKDTLKLDIHLAQPPVSGFDFKSSSAALQAFDTTKSRLAQLGVQHILVRIHCNSQIVEYKYPIQDLLANKAGMDIGVLFFRNFLSSRNEHNAQYVDLDKISLEDLMNLNTINEQIQTQVQITEVTFDGFTSHLAEPQNIEIRGNLQGSQEIFPFVIQYDKNKQKIFYFGINE